MPRYQIRTPDSVVLEDVLERMGSTAWLEIEDDLEMSVANFPVYRSFQDQIRAVVDPYVNVYCLCGRSNICTDGVSKAPLSNDPEHPDVNPSDLIYQLFSRSEAKEFVRELAFETYVKIENVIKPAAAGRVFEAINRSFAKVLGNYLYENPYCGKTELCAYSQKLQLTPWGRE